MNFVFDYYLQAASFGGSNIDPTAWEDKKKPGESRFPAQVEYFALCIYREIHKHTRTVNIAWLCKLFKNCLIFSSGCVSEQVRVVTRKICEPLEEDSFRPILHHYDGPKFWLELNVPEALSLLDVLAQKNNWIYSETHTTEAAFLHRQNRRKDSVGYERNKI